MVMATWYPSRYTAFGYGVRQGNLAAGITTGIYVIREFSPELKRLFRHRDKTGSKDEVNSDAENSATAFSFDGLLSLR
jgi:hypothetical protein